MDTTESEPDYKQAARELAARIESIGLRIEFEPLAHRSRGVSNWDKEAVHFRFTLSGVTCGKRIGSPDKVPFILADTRSPFYVEHRGEYSVGSAIPVSWARELPIDARPKGWGLGWSARDIDDTQFRNGKPLTTNAQDIAKRIRAAYRPSIVDVLSSMLMDVSEYEPDMTFRKWCDHSGMEWPHPADAVEAYEAIRASSRFLREVCTEAELSELRDLSGRM
jgi:hypothetical protein